MKINKDKVRQLIGSGKTEQAIKELLVITKKVDEATHSQVTNLQGQYSKLKSEEIAGILSTDESNRRLAKINKSLLTIIIVLPDNYPEIPKKDESGGTETPPPPKPPNGTTTAPNSNNSNGQPLSALNYVLLFLLLLIVSIGTLALLAAGNYTQDRFLQYCVLVILGLVVGTFTHGVMNSRSRLEGKKAGIMVQLGGPIVACLLVVVGGYYFMNRPVYGCINPRAENHNPNATHDDGSCIILGCTDSSAINFDPDATRDNGSCKFSNEEPKDPTTTPQKIVKDRLKNPKTPEGIVEVTPKPSVTPKPNQQLVIPTSSPPMIGSKIPTLPSTTEEKTFEPKTAEKEQPDTSQNIQLDKVTFLIKCKDYEIDNLIITNSDNKTITPRIKGKGNKIVTIHELPKGEYNIKLITKHPTNPVCPVSVNQNLKKLIMSANNNSCNEIFTNF